MTLRIEQGDLFDSGLPALAHGCNTTGAMGSGIAVEFRRRWPAMYDAYRARCLDGRFALGDVMPWWANPTEPVVFNLATQPGPGRCASLSAIRLATETMLDLAQSFIHVDAIGLPRIGCGLGGLDWPDVRLVLDAVAHEHPVGLVVYEL